MCRRITRFKVLDEQKPVLNQQYKLRKSKNMFSNRSIKCMIICRCCMNTYAHERGHMNTYKRYYKRVSSGMTQHSRVTDLYSRNGDNALGRLAKRSCKDNRSTCFAFQSSDYSPPLANHAPSYIVRAKESEHNFLLCSFWVTASGFIRVCGPFVYR